MNVFAPNSKLGIPSCSHQTEGGTGLALVSIGNSLRGDDGVAAAICQGLSKKLLANVCWFDLGTYTGHLSQCLAGHRACVIVDSTCNHAEAGTIAIMDLSAALKRSSPLQVKSCHGLSLVDELRLAEKAGNLPGRVIFFGVEADNVDFNDQLSAAIKAKLPQLIANLSLLVSTIVETIKREV